MKIVFSIYYCKLTRKGPRIDVTNSQGQSALLLLVRRRAIGAVEEMLQREANIQKVDYKNEGYMFYALGSGLQFEKLTRLFINKGGNLNLTNSEGVRLKVISTYESVKGKQNIRG